MWGINFDVVRPHARIGVRTWAGLAVAVFFMRRMSVLQLELAQASADPLAHLLPLHS